jgi:hypothetical protein
MYNFVQQVTATKIGIKTLLYFIVYYFHPSFGREIYNSLTSVNCIPRYFGDKAS